MGDWADRRKNLTTALRKHAVPVLRAAGFTGSFPHFRMTIDDRIHVLGFQFSTYGPQFYIEIGIASVDGSTFGGTHYPPQTIKHYQSLCRRRIGELPFDYSVEDPMAVALRATDAILLADPAWQLSIQQWQNLSSH